MNSSSLKVSRLLRRNLLQERINIIILEKVKMIKKEAVREVLAEGEGIEEEERIAETTKAPEDEENTVETMKVIEGGERTVEEAEIRSMHLKATSNEKLTFRFY